jgi:hypothetical protein
MGIRRDGRTPYRQTCFKPLYQMGGLVKHFKIVSLNGDRGYTQRGYRRRRISARLTYFVFCEFRGPAAAASC